MTTKRFSLKKYRFFFNENLNGKIFLKLSLKCQNLMTRLYCIGKPRANIKIVMHLFSFKQIAVIKNL